MLGDFMGNKFSLFRQFAASRDCAKMRINQASIRRNLSASTGPSASSEGPKSSGGDPDVPSLQRPFRVVHFTDVHFFTSDAIRPGLGLFGKRALGMINMLFNRGSRAFDPVRLLPSFTRSLSSISPDLVVFSGDLTTLATKAEFDVARNTLNALLKAKLPVVMIPGNHDRYTSDSKGLMEEAFGPWMAGGVWRNGEWTDGSVRTPWPKQYQVGPLNVIALDHCRPVLLSTGKHSEGQLARLQAVLASEKRPTIIVGHYPLKNKLGGPYNRMGHCLEDRDELETIISSSPCVVAYLHGHEHRWFVQSLDRTYNQTGQPPITVLNCGSTTYVGKDKDKQAGFYEFEISSQSLSSTGNSPSFVSSIKRHHWQDDKYVAQSVLSSSSSSLKSAVAS